MSQYAPFVVVISLVVLALLIPCRWDPAIRWKEAQIRAGFHPEAHEPGHPDRWMDFVEQARRDQQETDYPGCCRGIMFCRSSVCGCANESKSNDCFIEARARLLSFEQDGQ